MAYYFFVKYTPNRDDWRYKIAAPNVETVDEWWREIQDSGKVTRLATDLFTFNTGYWYDYLPEYEKKWLWSKEYTSAGPMVTIHHNPPRSDPIHGKTFYIRSKSQPSRFWYVTAEGAGRIYSSSLGRTRFRIWIDGEKKDKEQVYMIPKDKIVITKASDPKYIVGVNSGILYLAESSHSFSYPDLKTRFLAEGEERGSGETRNDSIVKFVDDPIGEEWELVY